MLRNVTSACKRMLLFLVTLESLMVLIIFLHQDISEPGVIYAPSDMEPTSWSRDSSAGQAPPVSSLTYNCSQNPVANCLTGLIPVLLSPSKGQCSEPLDLLLVIITTHDHSWRRQIIRENIKRQQQQTRFKFELLFLLGRGAPPQSKFQPISDEAALAAEAELHGDILQGDFLDVYVNNTYKAIFAFQWFHTNCKGSKYLMKGDDDISLHLEPMLTYVEAHVAPNKSLSRFMMGRCDLSRDIVSYRRLMRFKNLLPERIYPDDYIPPYCAGGAYLLPPAVVADLVAAVPWVPLIFVEDIYVGVVIARLKHAVNILHLPDQFIMGYVSYQYPALCTALRAGEVFAVHSKHAEGLDYFATQCLP